jgi:hypothetical protein
MSATGPQPRRRSPGLAAGHRGSPAATVASGPQGATYARRGARATLTAHYAPASASRPMSVILSKNAISDGAPHATKRKAPLSRGQPFVALSNHQLFDTALHSRRQLRVKTGNPVQRVFVSSRLVRTCSRRSHAPRSRCATPMPHASPRPPLGAPRWASLPPGRRGPVQERVAELISVIGGRLARVQRP